MKFYNNINLLKNEIQNFRVQNMAEAPSNPVVGQHYYNTVDNTEYVYNGTTWIDCLSQGDYTFENGIIENSATRHVSLNLATGENAGDIAFTADANGLAGSVDLTGYAEAAAAADVEETDDIKTALGKLEAKADEKVVKNADITAGTHTKITYDAKGLVTGGADLSEADIPNIHLAKVTDVTATAAEVNVLDGIEVTTEELNALDNITGNVQDQLDNKVEKNDAITGATKTKITYDAKGLVTAGADLSEADIPAIHLEKVTDVTATAAEVNVLDGITASTAELNILDGVTADKDEINILDGATLTTTELNYVDGVTSSIQDQLDSKVEKNDDITAGTKTKITYDAKGLVTGGADLSEADIPSLHLAKITDVTVSAADVNQLDGIEDNVQDQLDAKVEKNADITAGTHTKITYDAKGLVTAGADLSQADIPELNLTKISDVTATAAEVNQLHEAGAVKADFEKLHAITVTAADLNNIVNKIELTDLSAVGPITYDNTTGAISAEYDNVPTADSNKLMKSGAIKTALDLKLDTSLKGAANGLAELDANGLVPATQLPSYVDDVIDLVAIAATAPAVGAEGAKYYNSTDKKIYTSNGSAWGNAADPETGKIYVADEMAYRWSGTAMVQIGADKLKGYTGTIAGDGTTTTFTINHNLGTRNVVCEIYDATTYEKVYVNLIHSSNAAVQAVFSTAPAVGEDFVITIVAFG